MVCGHGLVRPAGEGVQPVEVHNAPPRAIIGEVREFRIPANHETQPRFTGHACWIDRLGQNLSPRLR